MNSYEQYFHLRDHPFAPDNGVHVRPDQELRLFEGDVHAFPYFVRLKAFAGALDAVDELLGKQNMALRTGRPPAVMVVGPRGAGRSTVAAYVAYRLREICRSAALPTPDFMTINEHSEDLARALEAIRPRLLRHLMSHGVDVRPALEIVGKPDPAKPSTELLASLFDFIAQDAPPDLAILVLAIGPITRTRKHWMGEIRRLLAPLRVMPVFFTEDTTVGAEFDRDSGQAPRLRVVLNKLEHDDTVELLRQRFKVLATAAREQPGTPPLFPYPAELVARVFPEGEKTYIKQFVALCSAALDERLTKLEQAAAGAHPETDAHITWDDFQSAIRHNGRR